MEFKTCIPPSPHGKVKLVSPSKDFDAEKFLGSHVTHAKLHSTAAEFFHLTKDAIIRLYTQGRPQVNAVILRECLDYVPTHFKWTASDLYPVRNSCGEKKMVLLEMNSRPVSASMPPLSSSVCSPSRNYRLVLDLLFGLEPGTDHAKEEGDIAILYDTSVKAEPYAHLAANMLEGSESKVWYVQWQNGEKDPSAKWDRDGMMHVRDNDGIWHPIRACLRFLGEHPWTRIPLHTKTVILNDIVSDLAGGRNKSVAAIAYAEYNEELRVRQAGLQICYPTTISNLPKKSVADAVKKFGGVAIVKVPYGHSGQGVYMIESHEDLNRFQSEEHYYDNFVVQPLITPEESNLPNKSGFTLLGTNPQSDVNGHVFTFDLRFVVLGGKDGIRPHLACGRRARVPQTNSSSACTDSLTSKPTLWDRLGTNISLLLDDQGNYGTDESRVLLLDDIGMEQMQLSMDDLLEAYVQTVLATIAVDRMSKTLMPKAESFDKELFAAVGRDERLLNALILDSMVS